MHYGIMAMLHHTLSSLSTWSLGGGRGGLGLEIAATGKLTEGSIKAQQQNNLYCNMKYVPQRSYFLNEPKLEITPYTQLCWDYLCANQESF